MLDTLAAHGRARAAARRGSGRCCFPPMDVARVFDGKSATSRMPSRIHGLGHTPGGVCIGLVMCS